MELATAFATAVALSEVKEEVKMSGTTLELTVLPPLGPRVVLRLLVARRMGLPPR